MGLDGGEGADAVAVAGGGLEVEGVAGRHHDFGVAGLDVAGAAGQKGAGLLHLGGVVGGGGTADAGRGAALDLILKAGPRARGKHAVGAGAQHEAALERRHGAVDRARRGERAEIVAGAVAGAPMLGQLRKGVVASDEDVGEALVVPQQHIIARHEALDEIAF